MMANHIIHGLGKVLHVFSIETCHGDSSVVCQVDMVLFLQDLDLRRAQAREGEHANLIHDMVP